MLEEYGIDKGCAGPLSDLIESSFCQPEAGRSAVLHGLHGKLKCYSMTQPLVILTTWMAPGLGEHTTKTINLDNEPK